MEVRDEDPTRSIRFDDVELDLAAMVIRDGDEIVHVEPQVFEVLAYLALERDRVVTKNELLDNVWGDRFVSESALTSRIKSARRAVGDDGRAQRVIRTVHGRGYQFVADVQTTEHTSVPAPVAAPTGRDDFVGRDSELAAVAAELAAHRLVTLVGPGGVGKTRLAVEVARVWEDEGRSVDIVELDAVGSHTQVAHQICDALGVRSQGDVDLIALAAQELRGPPRLLVLDNFEHVCDAAMEVERLRELVPELRICVTSRERLRVSHEQVVPLGPLDSSPEDGAHAPAIALFQTLARRFDPSFTIDKSNARLVSEICRLVDGLPLGLDLATAQLPYMSLEHLRRHLEQDAGTIEHDLRDRPERQRTVGDLIGWSHDLLPPEDQALLARLSVFRGGIPLSGVRVVGELDSDVDALRRVARLADKSLVVADRSGAEPRYNLLNLIRSVAGDRLAAADDVGMARALHASWVADVVVAIEADRWDRNDVDWLDELNREYPNVAAALEHLAEVGDDAAVARIVADTNLWWYRIGRHGEARRWIGVALDAEDRVEARSLGRIHLLAGVMAFAAQRVPEAVEHYRLAVALAEEAGDWRYLQLARSNLAIRALADPEALPSATAELEAVVADATERAEPAVLSHALNTLGVVLHRTGKEDEARASHEQGLNINRQIGDSFNEALNHANIGHIEVEAERPDSALVSARAALVLASRIGASLLAAWMLSEIASAERMRGNSEEAAVLIGASEAYIDAIGAHRGPAAHQSWHALTVERLSSDLGESEFGRLRAVGGTLPFKEAIERALCS